MYGPKTDCAQGRTYERAEHRRPPVPDIYTDRTRPCAIDTRNTQDARVGGVGTTTYDTGTNGPYHCDGSVHYGK